MLITQTDNCILEVKVIDSGIKGVKTLEIHRNFPQAQSPRWQRELQINATPCQLWDLATLIHNAAKE